VLVPAEQYFPKARQARGIRYSATQMSGKFPVLLDKDRYRSAGSQNLTE
jgi:hypothetical protein